MSTPQNVFTIPAGTAFANALAQKLLEETKDKPEALSQIQILLPTRRACRVLREAFLSISNGKPLLLPRMQPLGDIDEEELTLSIAGQGGLKTLLDLPPAISPLRRQILLARTIMALPDFGQGPDHALALSTSLGQLMDQVYTENLSLKNLHTIVPEEFAEHWQITINFLKILSVHWPKILEEQNVIDGADRRNRLLLALSAFWQKHPPKTRIITAGTTGSIPATAQLLKTVANLPNGQIVLPGLSINLDDESWNALDEPHPQYGFKHLLDTLEIDRRDVQLWNDTHQQHPISQARTFLTTEIMRPAEQTGQWMELKTSGHVDMLNTALDGLSLFECDHEGEEAQLIALLMREILESPRKTAALITPDRTLAKRVTSACRRWGITLDDSAGLSLDQTGLGAFLKLCLHAPLDQFAPINLLALLKNQHCTLINHNAVSSFEQKALRGPKPAPGFVGLRARLENIEQAPRELFTIINTLESVFLPFLELCDNHHPFGTFLNAHITLAEMLAGQSHLWTDEAGEEAAKLFAQLHDEAHLLGDISAQQYFEIFNQFLRSKTVRPAYGTHPRLMILGQLEARLINADLVILGGLNEGTWPPDPAHDPWMSRPMRKDFGLPTPERSIGLAAHDFVQGFCAPNVVLTRAKRKNGSPTVPARWLQRLETVMDAAGLPKDRLKEKPHQHWLKALDKADHIQPFTRPEPRPPIDKRPKELSATRIEVWQKDPYAIYARYVLKLRKLDPLEQDTDAARRGTMLHDVLDRFVRAHPKDLPENAAQILHNFAAEEIENNHDDSAMWGFWWPRFTRLSTWYIDHEQNWRVHAKPYKTEITGKAQIKSENHALTLSARADRIDLTSDGAALIDYKSGGTYSLSKIKSGALPQLSTEALIIAKGGFKNVPAHISSLSYWTLTGGSPPGKIFEISDDIDDIIERTHDGLKRLIESFGQQETPYYSLPRPDNAPRFNDYEHLARIKEWTALGENDTAEAA